MPQYLSDSPIERPDDDRMTAFHDGADQEAGLAAARTAFQNTRSG